jgi:hypothetical protein
MYYLPETIYIFTLTERLLYYPDGVLDTETEA